MSGGGSGRDIGEELDLWGSFPPVASLDDEQQAVDGAGADNGSHENQSYAVPLQNFESPSPAVPSHGQQHLMTQLAHQSLLQQHQLPANLLGQALLWQLSPLTAATIQQLASSSGLPTLPTALSPAEPSISSLSASNVPSFVPPMIGFPLQLPMMQQHQIRSQQAGGSFPAVPVAGHPQVDAASLFAALIRQHIPSLQTSNLQTPAISLLNPTEAARSAPPAASLSVSGAAAPPDKSRSTNITAPLTSSQLDLSEEIKPALSNRPPVCLALDMDENALSPYQCELRKHIELFETLPADVRSGAQGRNTPIRVGQVGIRCRHCANIPRSASRLKKGTMYYSRSLEGLYQVAQNLSKVHLCNSCPNISEHNKSRLREMQLVNKRATGGKEYWVYGLKTLFVYEDNGILRFRPLGYVDDNTNESTGKTMKSGS